MGRKNRNAAPKPVIPPIAAADATLRVAESAVGGVHVAKRESGAGNLSPEDLAAIRGEAAPELLTASEMLSSGGVQVTEGQPFREASPEELTLAARVLTLEVRLTELQDAVELLAAQRPGQVQAIVTANAPVAIVPPTPAEQAAYSETNFALWQDGKPGHNGIQAWRDAGSPVLKAKPVETPQRGRAA